MLGIRARFNLFDEIANPAWRVGFIAGRLSAIALLDLDLDLHCFGKHRFVEDSQQVPEHVAEVRNNYLVDHLHFLIVSMRKRQTIRAPRLLRGGEDQV